MQQAAESGCPDEPVPRSLVQSGIPMQVIKETMPALKALGACQSDCWLWPSITQVGMQASLSREVLSVSNTQRYARPQ